MGKRPIESLLHVQRFKKMIESAQEWSQSVPLTEPKIRFLSMRHLTWGRIKKILPYSARIKQSGTTELSSTCEENGSATFGVYVQCCTIEQ